jgi:hypothetical protein
MLITGYRRGANSLYAIKAVHKHTNLDLITSKRLIEDVLEGRPRELPNDFVLREELEALNFILE